MTQVCFKKNKQKKTTPKQNKLELAFRTKYKLLNTVDKLFNVTSHCT